MWERWNNHEWIVKMGSTWVMWGGLCWLLGVIFIVLGIIADAANKDLGLTAASWFFLAIAALVISAIWYLSWAVAVYVDAIKTARHQ